MINPFKEINWRPNTAEKRKFAVSLMIGFPVLALLFLIGLRLATGAWHPSFPLKLGAIGFGVGIVLWLVPVIARPFYVVWYALACCIGIIVGNVLFAAVYYLLVTGTGLALRLFGRCPISKGPNPAATTYWLDAEQPPDVNRYFRQF